MRVKEDRLSMKWEDERCQFVRHIETLTETNEMLLAEQAKQNDSYNNLLGTIASFNPISSSGVSPYETTAKNRFRQANTANGASKRPRPLNDDENDFISINRNKQLKKGSIDNFFASANSVPVSKFTTKKPKHKNTLSISTKAAEVANLVDPNDNEWWNIPTVGTTNINKAAVVSAGGQKAAWNSGKNLTSTISAEFVPMSEIVIHSVFIPRTRFGYKYSDARAFW